ncbi:unnamed protein product [Closterium sp. NIES-64]|nr:unnamed protein product [Closterium sp. NIES-64]
MTLGKEENLRKPAYSRVREITDKARARDGQTRQKSRYGKQDLRNCNLLCARCARKCAWRSARRCPSLRRRAHGRQLPRAPRGERGAKLRCCAEIEAQRAALPVVAGEGEGVEAAGSSSAVCGETGSGKQSVSKKFRRCCGVGERAGVRGVGERAGVRGVGERAGACGVGERAGVRGVGKGQVLGTVSALTGLELWELDKRLAKLKRPGWTRVGLSSYS